MLASYDYLSALYGNMFGTVFMSICLAIYAAAVFIAENECLILKSDRGKMKENCRDAFLFIFLLLWLLYG